jgi:5-methyltetrahydrofolate--homocysteine methyltransferase
MDLNELKEYVIEGKAEETEAFTLKALSEGMEASDIVNNGLIPGMDIVGDKFENREYYMPEMLVSAKAMKRAMVHLKPLLTESGSSSGLRAVCGTVTGDLHDIGVSLVGMMLEGAGFEVIYLGVDKSPSEFLAAMKSNGAHVLCMSALLTTTINNMGTVIQTAKDTGVRDSMKIYVGGAPVTEKFSNQIGANGYRPDAGSAIKMIKKDFEVD